MRRDKLGKRKPLDYGPMGLKKGGLVVSWLHQALFESTFH